MSFGEKEFLEKIDGIEVGNGLTISVTDKDTINSIVDRFVEMAIEDNSEKYLKTALKIDEKKTKDKIRDRLDSIFQYGYGLESFLEAFNIIQKITKLDLTEDLKEKLKENYERVSIEEILKVFKICDFSSEEKDKIITDKLNPSERYWDFRNVLEKLELVKEEYGDISSKVLNNKKIFDRVLEKIADDWRSFIKIGRGYYYGNIRELFINLNKVRELLSQENLNKIQEFLVAQKEDVDLIIKRRVGKKEHIEYIKAMINFLPQVDKEAYEKLIIVKTL